MDMEQDILKSKIIEDEGSKGKATEDEECNVNDN